MALEDIEFNCPDCLQIEKECYNCRRAMGVSGVGHVTKSLGMEGIPSFKLGEDGELVPMNEAAENFDFKADGYSSWEEFAEHMKGVMMDENIMPKKQKAKKKNPLEEFDISKALTQLSEELAKELPLDFAKYNVDPEVDTEPAEQKPTEQKPAPSPKKPPRKPRKPKE